MEYLDGITLEDLVQQFGPQPAERVIHIVRQMCASLYEAHRIGLIHRDVKPANAILCERAEVSDVLKVVDFGLVKEVDAPALLGEVPPRVSLPTNGPVRRSSDTQIGTVVGTPLYMAPECILTPDQIDARSDLYSVGCVAYFLLTGTDVFPAQSVAEVCGRHASMPPEPPSQRLRDVAAGKTAAMIQADLERVILRCLAKSPRDRPADARELSEALASCAGRRWADADAAAWWTHHRARVRAHRESRAPTSGMASTIAVDIASRV